MSELLQQAELEKLAVTLDAPLSQLAFLGAYEVETLRALRNSVSAALFDRQVKRFQRLADSTKLLPNKLVAMITVKVIPPMLSAQITGLLEPDDAVDLASRLDVEYLADVCVAMDPRRAAAVLCAMPSTTVVEVAMEMQRRRAFMPMARFVDALTDEQISAVAQRMSAEGLLHVGFFVESQARLSQLIGLLDEEQLSATMPAAAADQGAMWPQALSMVERVDQTQRARLSNVLSSVSPDVLDSLTRALFEQELWREALPMLEAMDDAAQEIVVAALASHADQAGQPDHLESFAQSLSERLQRKIQIALGRV